MNETNSKLRQLTGAPLGLPGSQVVTPQAGPRKPDAARASMDPQRQREIAAGAAVEPHERVPAPSKPRPAKRRR